MHRNLLLAGVKVRGFQFRMLLSHAVTRGPEQSRWDFRGVGIGESGWDFWRRIGIGKSRWDFWRRIRIRKSRWDFWRRIGIRKSRWDFWRRIGIRKSRWDFWRRVWISKSSLEFRKRIGIPWGVGGGLQGRIVASCGNEKGNDQNQLTTVNKTNSFLFFVIAPILFLFACGLIRIRNLRLHS